MDKICSSYPKGLVQPRKGYRFSIDSLLLVSFVRLKKKQLILDLGTGCGVLGIGLLLLYRSYKIKVFGIDINKDLIECAKENINLFGFKEEFFLFMGDIKQFRPKESIFDVVVVNPPYRFVGEGRISAYETKRDACFNTSASVEDFVKISFFSLKNRGDLYMVFLAEKFSYIVKVLKDFRFEPKRIKFVHPRQGKNASLVLIHAKKNGKVGAIIEPPLILYLNKNNTPTEDLKQFCPFISN